MALPSKVTERATGLAAAFRPAKRGMSHDNRPPVS